MPKPLRILSVAIILTLWEVLSKINLLNENLFPAFSIVLKAMFQGLMTGELVNDTIQSVRRVLIGYLLGSATGLILGFTSAMYRRFGDFLVAPIEFLRPIPPIAWIPISILWFGAGEPSAFFLVSLGAFFPIFTNSFLGVSQVQTGTLEVAVCHGASKPFIFNKIILPQALPSVFSGLQTGLGVAWMIVITAELVGVQSGLGYFIQISRAQLQIDNVIAGMGMIGLIGYGLNQLLKLIGKRVMPWNT